jgi:ATP-dependent helicase/nuclease subunit A
LRSPIFSFTEAQMQLLSMSMQDAYSSWWDALQAIQDKQIQKAARYLEHWRSLGEVLPVHDLLDLIYQESDLRIHYAVAAQNLARAQVLANLDAFLELALNQDGGRYPSLSRFIDEINAMRRGDDDETPDEGDVEAEAEMDEDIGEVDLDSEMSEEERHRRVRLMTIHGSKGLEAPFVIMLDANNTEWKAPHRGVLLDWSPEHAAPSHLSLYTKKTLTGERERIRQKENEVSQNENWNLLYVAMTRAKQGFWMSGVQSRTTGGINERSWYGRALAAGIEVLDIDTLDLQEKIEHPARDKDQIELGSMPFKIDHFDIVWDQAKQSHQEKIAQIENGTLNKIKQTKVEAPDPELLDEGTHFHKLLEFLTTQTGTNTKPEIPNTQEIMAWLGTDPVMAQKLQGHVQTVLNTRELKPYLTQGKWLQAWNELDIVSEAGKSYRMDRLVEFDDHLAILDYKLSIPQAGSEKYKQYQAQLQNYQKELERIRKDKPSKAYLISATGQITQVA